MYVENNLLATSISFKLVSHLRNSVENSKRKFNIFQLSKNFLSKFAIFSSITYRVVGVFGLYIEKNSNMREMRQVAHWVSSKMIQGFSKSIEK